MVVTLGLILLANVCNASSREDGGSGSEARRVLRVGSLNNPNSWPLLVSAVTLNGGVEFDDPDSYQLKALQYVTQTRGLTLQDDDFFVYYALACIYYATFQVPNKNTEAAGLTTLDPWTTSTNWVDATADKCTWHGITCENNNVMSIRLDSNNLFGFFPPEVQFLASSLKIIDLFDNYHLTTVGDAGNDWMGLMTNLERLYFGTTSFEYDGTPIFWNKLSKLEQLDCANSLFTGPIRGESFNNFPELWWLDLSNNFWTSTIPTEITNLPSLTNFYMQRAEFVGVEQDLFYLIGMPQIYENWMDHTPLAGSIPTEIGTVSTLGSFSVIFCGLTGTLPIELGNLANLDFLYVYQNDIVGTVPTELGMVLNLKHLYVESTQLVGSMPSEICFNRPPLGVLTEVGANCHGNETFVLECNCCTCCGEVECEDFTA